MFAGSTAKVSGVAPLHRKGAPCDGKPSQVAGLVCAAARLLMHAKLSSKAASARATASTSPGHLFGTPTSSPFRFSNPAPSPTRPQLHTTLSYVEASAGAMTLASTGDLFVYLNGELVVNLGGVHAEQSVSLVFDQVGPSGADQSTLVAQTLTARQKHGSIYSPYALHESASGSGSGGLARPRQG